MTDFWSVLGALAVLGLVAALVYLALDARRERRRKTVREVLGIGHLDLYFAEHFPAVAHNFDLVSKGHFNEWAATVDARLQHVERDLGLVAAMREKVDPRVGDLERKLDRLEKA